MRLVKSKIKKFLPLLLIAALAGLNMLAYKTTKSYFTKAGVQEVEELTEMEQGENGSLRLLSWTLELFKSFRNPDKNKGI